MKIQNFTYLNLFKYLKKLEIKNFRYISSKNKITSFLKIYYFKKELP